MSPPSSSSARLDVTQGPLQGQSVFLNSPETVAGREAGCGLSLTSYREVSRRHARFYLQDGTWCVEDLGSTNGTFVNSVRATPSFSLADGAQIQMGDFHARFRLPTLGASPSSPQATQHSPAPPPPIPPQVPPQVAPMPVVPTSTAPYPVIYPPQPPKNVAVAILLSFLFAGLGQLYNGEIHKALPMLIAHFFAWVFTAFCFIGFPAVFALWVWSMVDAYQSAERINREAGWPRSY